MNFERHLEFERLNFSLVSTRSTRLTLLLFFFDDDGLEPDFSPAVLVRGFVVLSGCLPRGSWYPDTTQKSVTATAGEKSG